jgi:hypothetical protein
VILRDSRFNLLRRATPALHWPNDLPIHLFNDSTFQRFNVFTGFPHPPPVFSCQSMFDTITAGISTASEKLAHLRRFL